MDIISIERARQTRLPVYIVVFIASFLHEILDKLGVTFVLQKNCQCTTKITFSIYQKGQNAISFNKSKKLTLLRITTQVSTLTNVSNFSTFVMMRHTYWCQSSQLNSSSCAVYFLQLLCYSFKFESRPVEGSRLIVLFYVISLAPPTGIL